MCIPTMTFTARDIATLCLHDSKHFEIQLHQTQHRLNILSQWPISEGQHILELGCGQGDCTAVLAELVGEQGRVTAVDPASLDYGTPWTLGQSQTHLSSGRVGKRITWIQANPLDFLKNEFDSTKYDVAVLAHCLWYFSSPDIIAETLQLLAKRAHCVCIAEWSLVSSSAPTHILAILAQASLECRKPQSESNVRTVVSPQSIKKLAENAGLALQMEDIVSPGRGVVDGKWEVEAVINDKFLEEVEKYVKDGREKGVLLAMRDAVKNSLDQAGGLREVVTMDAWSAVFSAAKATPERL